MSQRYRSLNRTMREIFGFPVRKVSLKVPFSCPNLDGTVAFGGCTFCNTESIRGLTFERGMSIGAQLEAGIAHMERRFRNTSRYIAYFQEFSNTYAPLPRLRRLYAEALRHPKVIGIAVGTRPDCVPEPVLDLFVEIARTHHVFLEYGLQSAHDTTLDAINRGHHFRDFEDAVIRTKRRGLPICAHVILGLPGETLEMMRATARALVDLEVEAVKIHNLHVVRNTLLARQYAAGEYTPLDEATYIEILIDFLEHLSPAMVIERLVAAGPKETMVAPEWCIHKFEVLARITAQLDHRDTWQGKALGHPREALDAPVGGAYIASRRGDEGTRTEDIKPRMYDRGDGGLG
ncbi:MAG: TIGR01212 family radical SAM protein [Deltaproteobacteria bacterium]|nr:MAG: TIGR01212 family radical SAM protein [Deltaproteobacteria bacterium]